MTSAPQGNSGGEGNAAQGNPVATFHTLEDNIAHIDSASPSIGSKGKMHQRAFSGGAKGNIWNTRSRKVAAVIHRAKAKGKRAQKAGPLDANPSSPEDTSDISSQEGHDLEVEPCMFTEGPVQHFADDICC